MHALSFHWQRQSQLSDNSMQSLLMNLLRGLASLQVAAAHLRAETLPGLRELADPGLLYTALAFFTGFAHQAVMVFFLISGWLVGGSLLNKIGQPRAIRSYAIDRVSRLWTVLVPALLLALVIGLATGAATFAPAGFDAAGEFSAGDFGGNLLGLQTIVVDRFGGNYPLWSLANETWYYIQFPLLLLILSSRSLAQQTLCAALLAMTISFLPQVLTLYFGIWLLGAAFSRIRVDSSVGARILLLALTAGVSVYYRLTGVNDDILPESFGQDLICALPIVILLAAMHGPLPAGAHWLRQVGRCGKWLSEFSFTLYVVHVPLINLLQYVGQQHFGRRQLNPARWRELALYFAALALMLIVSYLLYLVFERNTYRVRRFIKQRLLPLAHKPATPIVFSAD